MTVAMLLLAARLATAPGCDGLIVHSIDVRVDRPDFSGMTSRWRAVARSVGLHHASTQASVIRAFLALHVGQPCTERRRLESERMLRAQSFIGDAEVTAVPDSAGGVMVTVVSRDEIPVLAGARFHGIGLPETIELGSENIGGAGILGSGSLERADGYRTGVGARFVSTTAFGRPYRLTAEGERARLGHSVLGAFDHPLYTDLQHVAWHAAFLNRDDYIGIMRPADDGLALQLQQERWEVSGIIRAFGVRTVTVLGAGASRAHVTPSDSGVLVTDQGLQPDTGVALRNRYDSFLGTRVGPIVGLQRVRYATVSGFDALYATQDVLSGFRLGVFAARGLGGLGEADDFVSAAGYAGAASSRSLLAIATELEARRSLVSSQWDGVVGSGRAAFYLKAGDDVTVTISDELSMGSRSRLPVQLSIGDWRGGVRGYGGSALSGSTRNVVRTEARLARPAAVHAADVGIAAFFETGMLRAGDAPYGVSTTRSSAGISLLTAYPTRAKRMVRIDFAVPFDRSGTRANRVEVRLTMVDRTNHFWIEPGDVTRARTGGLPSAIFGWPNS